MIASERDFGAANALQRSGRFVLRHPVRTAGALLGGAAAVTIAVNALFMQDATHPAPFFATRPATSEPPPATSIAVATPPAAPATQAMPPPVQRSGPRVVQTVAATPPVVQRTPATLDRPLLQEIQTALASLGHYTGTVDGIYGSRTRAAIEAYQRGAGLPVNGQPSEQLAVGLIAAAAITDRAATGAIPTVDTKLLAIERALNEIGYGPVEADGVAGADTAAAIRRFELDNGLALTGTANDAVVRRLVEIGALAAI